MISFLMIALLATQSNLEPLEPWGPDRIMFGRGSASEIVELYKHYGSFKVRIQQHHGDFRFSRKFLIALRDVNGHVVDFISADKLSNGGVFQPKLQHYEQREYTLQVISSGCYWEVYK